MTRGREGRRPALLVFMMSICVVIGLGGLLNGCNQIQFYRGVIPSDPPTVALSPEQEQVREAQEALLKATYAVWEKERSIRVPFVVANFVLSMLLVVAAMRVLSRRPNARPLAVQALAANAAFAIVEYLAMRNVRGEMALAWAAHFPRAALPPMPDDEAASALAASYWLIQRTLLSSALLTYAVAYVSLSSRVAREHFAFVEAMADDERPDTSE